MTQNKLIVGILGAMDEEIQAYLEQAENIEEIKWQNFVFYRAELFNQQVVIVKSGIGKVFAAMVCQKMIDQFKPSHIIFTGLAGALNESLEIGDVLVSHDCLHHDLDARELGFSRGAVPYTQYQYFQADDKLKSLALSAVLEGHKISQGRILQNFTEFYRLF